MKNLSPYRRFVWYFVCLIALTFQFAQPLRRAAGQQQNTPPKVATTGIAIPYGKELELEVARISDAETPVSALKVALFRPMQLASCSRLSNPTNNSGVVKVLSGWPCGCDQMGPDELYILIVTDGDGAETRADFSVRKNDGVRSLGNYTNQTVALNGRLTITPSAAPTGEGTLAVTVSPAFQGSIQTNEATGVITITDAKPVGRYSLEIRAYRYCFQARSETQTIQLLVGELPPPVVRPIVTPLNVTQGKMSGLATLAAITDSFFGSEGLRAEAVNLPTGLQLSNQRFSFARAGGTTELFAELTASCGLTPGLKKLPLKITNAAGLSTQVELSVNVRAAQAPIVHYAPTQITLRDGVPVNFALFNQIFTGANPNYDQQVYYSNSPDQYEGPGPTVEIWLDAQMIHQAAPLYAFASFFYLRASAGPHRLRVILKDSCGLTTEQIIPVNVNGTSPTCQYPNFSIPLTTDEITLFTALAAGDFNGDGRTDAAVFDARTNQIKIYLALSDGSLRLAHTVATRRAVVSLIAEDFTRDGKPDLAFSTYDATHSLTPEERGVTLLAGNGDGNFTLLRHYQLGHGYMTMGDFNGDIHPDLAVGDIPRTNPEQDGRLRILLNNGQGQFTATTQGLGLFEPLRLLAAHLNGDNHLDIATFGIRSRFPNGEAYQFNGNGNGSFTPSRSVLQSHGHSVDFALAGDFNNDQRVDAAHTLGRNESNGDERLTNSFALFAGEQETFRARDFTPRALAVADFNRDGKNDIVFDTGTLFLTGGTQPYCAQPRLLTRAGFAQVATGDLNLDGRPDVIGIGSQGGLHVYLNTANIPSSLAVVSAASYDTFYSLAPEQIVAAFGTGLATATATASTLNLPTTLADTQVRVRDSLGVERPAPLFFVSPGQVNFLIPSDTSPGSAQVLLRHNNELTAAATITIAPLAPGLFSADATGKGLAAAQVLRVLSDGTQRYEPIARYDQASQQFVAVPIDLSNASEQVFLVLYGTGLRGRSALSNVATTVGGTACETLYAGAQGSLAGLDQVNVRLPRTLIGRGEVDVVFTAGGTAANAVRVNLK